MNASRLREILDLLLERQAKFEVPERLNELVAVLNEIVAQPQDSAVQGKFATALGRYAAANDFLRVSFEPTQVQLLGEIGADKFFVKDLAAEIRASIQANPISPAVTQQLLNTYSADRRSYVKQITQLRDGLKNLGIDPITLQPGDAEIGFLLPRTLFNNHLDELIKELRHINRVIRAFSEVTIGTAEDVEVRGISASDPLFFFHLDPLTIAAIGAAVTWALNTWKQVEDIRKVRSEVQKINVLTEVEAAELFDKKIAEKISAAIDAKVDELLKDDGKPGRAKEQRTDLRWALESIMAHVERGMIIEVRFVPPPPGVAVRDGQPDAEGAGKEAAFQKLQAISQQLSFPKIEGHPILKIPAPPAPDAAGGG